MKRDAKIKEALKNVIPSHCIKGFFEVNFEGTPWGGSVQVVAIHQFLGKEDGIRNLPSRKKGCLGWADDILQG